MTRGLIPLIFLLTAPTEIPETPFIPSPPVIVSVTGRETREEWPRLTIDRRDSGNSRCTRNIRTSDSCRVTAGVLVIEGTPATADVPGTSGQATAVGSQQGCLRQKRHYLAQKDTTILHVLACISAILKSILIIF